MAKDRALAKVMAITNQEQVAIVRFAQENASSNQVKRFAATMETGHASCLEALNKVSPPAEKAARERSSTLTGAEATSGSQGAKATHDAKNNQVTTTSLATGDNSESIDFLELKPSSNWRSEIQTASPQHIAGEKLSVSVDDFIVLHLLNTSPRNYKTAGRLVALRALRLGVPKNCIRGTYDVRGCGLRASRVPSGCCYV